MYRTTEVNNSATESINTIQFNDIFKLEDIQKLQDLFSEATGVASVITGIDGKPITQPSNFCRLCRDIIRKTEEGLTNCFKSDAVIGSPKSSGPVVQKCLSGGLWDAGASIIVGGQHIANWLIGQVRNEEVSEHDIIQYGKEIGADSVEFAKALNEVPVMSANQFNKVAEMLFAFVNEISDKAYKNLQLTIQIAEREKATQLLSEREQHFYTTLQSIGDAVIATDNTGLITMMNSTAERLTGWEIHEALNKPLSTVFNIVNANSGEPVENPVAKVIQTGQIMGLANHTELVSRNNNIYQISDSAAPIRNNMGVITGVILVFSDVTEKYLASRALKENQVFLSELIENNGASIYAKDIDGHYLLVNKKWEKVTGISRDAAYGKTDESLFAANIGKAFRTIDKKIIEKGEVIETEELLENETGKKYFLSIKFPIRDENNVIKGLCGISTDITDRKNAEDMARKIAGHFQAIIEKAPDGIVLLDSEGKFKFVSPSARKIFGYSVAEELETDPAKFTHPDDLPMVLSELAKIFADAQYTPTLQYRFIDKFGNWKWVESTFTNLLADPNVEAIVINFRDITERKGSEVALLQSEARHTAMTTNISDVIGIIDEQGNIAYNSPNIEKRFGWHQESLIGKSAWSIVHPEDVERILREFNLLLETEKNTKTVEFRLQCLDGSYKPVKLTALNLIKDPVINGVLINFHDITKRILAEAALRESEAFSKRLFDTSRTPIVVMDVISHKFIDCNQAAVEIYRLGSREEMLTKAPIDVSAPVQYDGIPSAEKVQFYIDKTVHEGEAVFEWLHQRPDGELWDAEVHLMSFYSGEQQLLQFTLQDISERKLVGEALRKSESFLKETQLIARLGTYSMDIASGSWESSEVLDTIFGIEADYDKSVEGWANIIHPDWQKTMLDYFINEVVANVTKFDKDYKIVRQNDKAERWVHGIGRLKCNEKNQPVTMLGTIGDITERKLAEETIRTMKLLLEQTFEQSPVPMVLVSMPDAIIRIANPACRDFLQINDEPSLIDTKLVDIKPTWLDYDMNGEAGTIESLPLMQSLLGNRTEGIERCIIRKDGSTRYELVHGIPIFDDNGQVIAGYLIMIDITERKLAEMELRKLSQAVQQSPTSVIITDSHGRIEYVNPKAQASTGKSVAELTGKNLRILLSNELAEEDFNNLVATVISSGKWEGEIYNQRADGELFWESASISPIINDNGEIIHLLAVKEDITEKKEILNELIDARDKAESASKLKDAFIANISHEIRTPLNGILGMTGIVQESYSRFASEEDHRIFRSIERSSKRLINTVDKILHFSRLQVGDFTISSGVVRISSILERLLTEYTPFVREKSIEIVYHAEKEDDTVIADETSLSTAFGNLIDNAIKFTDEGTIEITMYRDTNRRLCVDIKDTGPGISEEYLPGLFEPYSQELMGYSRPFEGLGLGLAIVKKLLSLNGASIAVKSKKGVGTEFTICFFGEGVKLAQANTPEATRIRTKFLEKPVGSKPVVLVVEDDEVNQLYIEVILKKQFEVKIAPSAGKALELFLEFDFTIIIMDISLKEGLNGLELTHVIRTGKKYPTIPILAVTGHALPEDHQRAIEAGCNDYLPKPFKGFQLLEKLEKLVNE